MNAIQSPWGRNFYASLVAQHVTPAMIRYFCRRLHSNKISSAAAEEVHELHAHMAAIKPLVLPEHKASGLVFLRNCAKAKRWREEFEDSDLYVLEAVDTIRWVDTLNEYRGARSATHPIFQVTRGQQLFEYWMRPWQSGSHFEICRHAD